MKKTIVIASILLALTSTDVDAAPESPSCRNVRFAEVGWTDTTVTTAVARYLLSSLGYETEVQRMTLPDIFDNLSRHNIDVFLGNWMPSQNSEIRPYLDTGRVANLQTNLEGARYTLAVPREVYLAGVKSFADIAQNAEKFGKTFYSLEPGNDGNRKIRKMIDENAFGLGQFKIDESTEKTMLAKVKGAKLTGRWAVFLAWEPHPMNTHFDIVYLSGGDDYFGAEYGKASVNTVTRRDYAKSCNNAGRLLKNLVFTLEAENQLMDAVMNNDLNPRQAARAFLKQNPGLLDQWLKDVKTLDGEPGAAAVKTALAR